MCKNMLVTGWFLETAGSIFNAISTVDINHFESKATWMEVLQPNIIIPKCLEVPPCIAPKYHLCITAS